MASDYHLLRSLLSDLPARTAEAAEMLERMLDELPADDTRRGHGLIVLAQLRSQGKAPGWQEWLQTLTPPGPALPRALPGAPPPPRRG
jgi:hypothetical protein